MSKTKQENLIKGYALENNKLRAEIELLQWQSKNNGRHWNAIVEWLNHEGRSHHRSGPELTSYLLDVILDPAWDYEEWLEGNPDKDWHKSRFAHELHRAYKVKEQPQ